MEDHKWPIFWCGGKLTNQDVSIRLVPTQINLHLTTNTSHQTLAELKVHSSCLRKYSKYFETCFNERWANYSSQSSLECELEVQGDITCYEDCFSRMYTPLFLKNFKDVTYTLQLLRVASQIQFHELMSSICQYLSTIHWSAEDETKIREYTSSQDFPRNHANDLVARLDLGLSKEDYRKQVSNAIEQCIHGDFCLDNHGNIGNLCKELLLGIGHSESSTFAEDVVTILNKEAKDVLFKLYAECVGKSPNEVPELQWKVTHVCRVMEALLEAQVAEEVMEYFLQFELYPKIFCNTENFFRGGLLKECKFDLRKFILDIFQEVLVGNLLLGISGRVALLQKWSQIFSLTPRQTVVSETDYKQIVQDLFLTLPFEQQMELIKLENNDYSIFIDSNSLATLLKNKWRVQEDVTKDDSL